MRNFRRRRRLKIIKEKCTFAGTKKRKQGHILCHCFFLEDFLQSPSPDRDGLSLLCRTSAMHGSRCWFPSDRNQGSTFPHGNPSGLIQLSVGQPLLNFSTGSKTRSLENQTEASQGRFLCKQTRSQSQLQRHGPYRMRCF